MELFEKNSVRNFRIIDKTHVEHVLSFENFVFMNLFATHATTIGQNLYDNSLRSAETNKINLILIIFIYGVTGAASQRIVK